MNDETNELQPPSPATPLHVASEAEPGSAQSNGNPTSDILPCSVGTDLSAVPEVQPLAAKIDTDEELIGPTDVRIKATEDIAPEGRGPFKAALSEQAIWLQATWQCKRIALLSVSVIEANQKKTKLKLTLGAEPKSQFLELKFSRSLDGENWLAKLEAQKEKFAAQVSGEVTGPLQEIASSSNLQYELATIPEVQRLCPQGVLLLTKSTELRHLPLGRIRFTDGTERGADRGLQLRAAMLGADAVLELEHERAPDESNGGRVASGEAVRVEEAADRKKLRRQWYIDSMSKLFWVMLALVVGQLVIYAGIMSVNPTAGGFLTNEEPLPRFLGVLRGSAWFYGWPLIVLILLRALKWPGLLPVAALAFITITTFRDLAVFFANLLASPIERVQILNPAHWLLSDPIDWFFILVGIGVTFRVLRLWADAGWILRGVGLRTPHPIWSRSLLCVTGLYAVAALGYAGYSRFEMSTYQFQPGVNIVQEQHGLTAINTGIRRLDQNDLPGAEQAFGESLRIWEDLTQNTRAPSTYRQNLALCLFNLGWIFSEQGRQAEAERVMRRGLSIIDDLAAQVPPDEGFDQDVARIRQFLAAAQNFKTNKELEVKDKTAQDKYEAGVIKADKGDPEAEGLFREAIALWEEVLQQAKNPEYRRHANGVLSEIYADLGKCLLGKSKFQEAESNFKKSVDYLETAASLTPDRPLLQHELERARERLELVRDLVEQQELEKLLKAERFADARDLMLRGIEKLEQRLANDKERAAATRPLAFRLIRLASFLAHCPSEGVRDGKEAVKASRRATQLDPQTSSHWLTYSLTLYRTNDWSNSLTALDELKAKQGEWGPVDYFLIAMNQFQLKKVDQAKASFRKGVDCWEEYLRLAEGNPEARVELERRRSAVEEMRQEADELIRGKIGV